jgi:hypothetical protein
LASRESQAYIGQKKGLGDQAWQNAGCDMGHEGRSHFNCEKEGNGSERQGKPARPSTDFSSPAAICQTEQTSEQRGKKEFECKHVALCFPHYKRV